LGMGAYPATPQKTEHDLQLTISSVKSNLNRGDEIPILFKMTNKGRTVYRFDDRDHDRSGRVHEWSLVAYHEDGREVPDPREDYDTGNMGGLSGTPKAIAPGESFEKTVTLNIWSLIKQAGRYTVVGTYHYSVPDEAAQRKYAFKGNWHRMVEVESEPIEITIGPRTDKEMAAYIAALTKELEALEGQIPRKVRRQSSIVEKLTYTCDARIVPTLIESVYLNGSGDALRFYVPRTNDVRNSIVEAALNRGLRGGMLGILEAHACDESIIAKIIAKSMSSNDPNVLHSAVLAAQTHPDDSYMERLIRIAADIENLTHHSAVIAIAYNRTDEGVQTLRRFFEDENKRTARTAQRAIKNAYRRWPVRPRQIDREYTAILAQIVEDMNDPLWNNAIFQIIRTRTQEGIAALRAHLEDPAKGNALIDRDEGLKAIRYWLRHPDPKTRSDEERSVRILCKVQRGRPLRTDDFAPEFQDFDAKQKKIILDNLKERQAAGSIDNQPGTANVDERPENWAKKLTLPGVGNFHKVSSVLYRGQQPTSDGMKALDKMGIKTVVNLRSFNSDRREMKDTNMLYQHITMKAWHAEDKELVRFLKIVTNKNHQPVFVHCQHGADRTGTMCAFYRIAVQGWTKDQAIEEMTKGGFGYHSIWKNLIDYIQELDVEKIKQKAGIAD